MARRTRPLAVALVAACVVASAALVSAGDPPAEKPAEAAAPKAVASAFLKGLVGAWETEMTEGDLGRHKGRSTWRLGMNDTAAMEDYASSLTTAEGKTVPWSAHVVCREGADGKSVEAWMFDNLNVPPLRFTGALTETGFDVSGDTPDGKMRVTYEKQGADRVVRIWMGEHPLVTEVYRPAPR